MRRDRVEVNYVLALVFGGDGQHGTAEHLRRTLVTLVSRTLLLLRLVFEYDQVLGRCLARVLQLHLDTLHVILFTCFPVTGDERAAVLLE